MPVAMAAGRVLSRLHQETCQYHAAIDAPWVDVLATTAVRQHYVAQLVRVYGFEAPLEAAFAYTQHLSMLVAIRPRQRAGLIVQDLLSLNVDSSQIAQIPECTAITPFPSVADALGWLYVAERATRLYDVVRQHLIARQPDLADACAYLGAYGADRDARWRELGEVLDELARNVRIEEQVVDAARQGCLCALAWFRRSEAQPHMSAGARRTST